MINSVDIKTVQEELFYCSGTVLLCTQEEIRTPTPFQAPAPQAGASTNFAT